MVGYKKKSLELMQILNALAQRGEITSQKSKEVSLAYMHGDTTPLKSMMLELSNVSFFCELQNFV